MRLLYTYILLTVISITAISQENKKFFDCTVTYDVTVQDEHADAQIIKSLNGSTKMLYLKGPKSRTDFLTPNFRQTTIYDNRTDTTVVLIEQGNTKYISYLDAKKRQAQNQKFEGIAFSPTSDRKTILGYNCTKVVATLADGATYNVYYTPALIPSNKTYEVQFKDLPGFVLEYEASTENGKTKIKYTATQISFNPVPAARFDVPTSGYRIL